MPSERLQKMQGNKRTQALPALRRACQRQPALYHLQQGRAAAWNLQKGLLRMPEHLTGKGTGIPGAPRGKSKGQPRRRKQRAGKARGRIMTAFPASQAR